MEKENSDLMTEFFGHGFFQHKSIVVGGIKNVMFRRILLVLVFYENAFSPKIIGKPGPSPYLRLFGVCSMEDEKYPTKAKQGSTDESPTDWGERGE